MRGRALVVVVATLVVAAAACGGSGMDKAGGTEDRKPVVLTLEQSDPLYSGAQFAAAVAERSAGSIRIEVSPDWHRDRVDFERGIVEDVRARRSDLGVVGVGVWDTLGVSSFQALIAPFLVDDLELERRVLESPLAARMLAGVEQVGVVGVALLPGPLRRPFGYTRALVRLQDYKGTRMGVYPGRVEEATFHSLGATTRAYLSLGGASREGAVLNFWGIAGGDGYRGKTVATNVVFWTRPETVVMNGDAFAALTPGQKEILLEAGRHAVGPRLTEIERLERDALRTICERRLASLVSVPPADVAALQAAVRPVYAELEGDPQTKRLIDEIRKLRQADTDEVAPRCPTTHDKAGAEIEGVWESSVMRPALLAAGASTAEAGTYQGFGTLELKGGRWIFRGEHTTVTGTYTVNGDVTRLTMVTCTANPCSPRASTDYTWSVYRDTLILSRLPGREFWPRLVAKPGRRVG